VAIVAMAPCAAAAQELASYQADSCRKFINSADAAFNRELLYARAACVAARAGVSSPENGPLSQEELLSILMLMSLPKTPGAAHAS
ncbi:MAG TPA: hypothetical protein VGF62_01270, partial [Rhizomicrobium sp.]